MDDNDIVRRLDQIRERIREHLADQPAPRLSRDLPPQEPLQLGESLRNYRVPTEPNLNSTPFLQTANDRATITGPVTVSSKVPVLGPLLTLLRRLARPLVQPLIDPYLDRQERFNSEIVRHLNELGQRLEKRLENLGAEVGLWIADPGFIEARLDAALADYDETLRSRLTVLLDAIEEEVWSIRCLVRDQQQALGRRLQEFDVRFVERAQAVDARFDEKDRALEDAVRSAGSTVSEAELQATRAMLRRTLAAATAGSASPDEKTSAPPGAWQALASWLDDADYRTFQDRFRGDESEIAARLRRHVQEFHDAPGKVVDLGCGRGEFVQLLLAAGIDAVGVEINDAEVATGLERGLEIAHADLFDWLSEQPTSSLGGIFLAQVIEHLPPADWSRFVDLAASRLLPGGTLLVETINPESLYAYARAFVIDPTHTRPVHPELLGFMARRAGLHQVQVRYQAAVPEAQKVAGIDLDGTETEAVANLKRELNYRLEKINQLCCASQEYALVARSVAATESA